ncbi:MAG: lysyl-tRNA synthetase, partial [Candidatus Brocadiaceae bacterium]|nr:lysyl-tRNA synthetase [Candidatus Brocadiaceae bacterium]
TSLSRQKAMFLLPVAVLQWQLGPKFFYFMRLPCGSTRIVYQGVPIDFSPPWRRMTILGGLKEHAGIDAARMTEGELTIELERHGMKDLQEAPLSWGAIVMKLFESLCEKHLVQPTFVLDYPIDVSPLTKVKRGDKRLVERFEPFVCHIEIGNAYSELTDPIDQLERFTKQRDMQGKDQGYEDNPLDVDFIKAVGCGMPPTGGVGLGIDRLVMFLTDTPNIRDIIPFPMVKPRN